MNAQAGQEGPKLENTEQLIKDALEAELRNKPKSAPLAIDENHENYTIRLAIMGKALILSIDQARLVASALRISANRLEKEKKKKKS